MLNTTYKTLALALIAGFALTVPVFAQDTGAQAGTPTDKTSIKEKKHHLAERMMKELNLTQEQKDKIKAIQEAQKAKLQPIRDNAKITPEEKRAQMKPILKDSMKQIMSVLTPEQKAKLKELREKRREMKEEKENTARP